MVNFLVTGATGLIGSALVKFLSNGNNHIVCPVRNLEKAKRIFNDDQNSNIEFVKTGISDFLSASNDMFDYIIHCASPTSSRYFIKNPVETLTFGIDSTVAILEYSRKNPVKSIVYLSSLESYGTVTDDSKSIDEDYQGYINPLDIRSSYNIVKRTCECLCHSYYAEYGVPVKIIRLTQTISPFIQNSDMRVFAQFARKAAEGKDIELHTEGSSSRQYIFIDDAISAIMTILIKGESGEAYNAANDQTYISARDLADFVQKNFNPSGKVIFKLRNDMGYAPTTKLKLNITKLKALGWNAQTSLYSMFLTLITNLKRIPNH